MIILANKLKCKLSSFRNIDLTLPSFMSVSFYFENNFMIIISKYKFFFKKNNIYIKKSQCEKKMYFYFRFSYKFFLISIHTII